MYRQRSVADARVDGEVPPPRPFCPVRQTGLAGRAMSSGVPFCPASLQNREDANLPGRHTELARRARCCLGAVAVVERQRISSAAGGGVPGSYLPDRRRQASARRRAAVRGRYFSGYSWPCVSSRQTDAIADPGHIFRKLAGYQEADGSCPRPGRRPSSARCACIKRRPAPIIRRFAANR